jgi:DNA-directed RNA polymerase specialized sigma24 family protein
MKLAGFSAMQISARSPIEQFVDLYYLPVFRFAARLCDDPAHALTLTDRTFRDALTRARCLPVPANVRAWLFSILFHKFLKARPRGLCV